MYKRILLKLSGEAFKDVNGQQIIDVTHMANIAKTIKQIHDLGVQIGVVIGAGNIWRGKLADEIGIDHDPADYMGMLGTIINAVALCSALKKIGVDGQVFSALSNVPDTTVTYNAEEAKKCMEEGKVCFFAGGTGKPGFTTDTAATLRAIETDCEAIFMGKNGVEGVYDKDPTKNPDAKFIHEITYDEILKMKLQIMDLSAVELIKDKDIEIRVFSMSNADNFIRVVNNEKLGTICKKGE
ncbi:MAG: UMP kinase [Bacilli bacterium]|nr:UMP kinase [Bacilli bacterium]